MRIMDHGIHIVAHPRTCVAHAAPSRCSPWLRTVPLPTSVSNIASCSRTVLGRQVRPSGVDVVGPLSKSSVQNVGPLSKSSVQSVGPLGKSSVQSVGPLSKSSVQSVGRGLAAALREALRYTIGAEALGWRLPSLLDRHESLAHLCGHEHAKTLEQRRDPER